MMSCLRAALQTQTKLEKNLCRCCLSEGEFCSLSTSNSGPVNTNQAFCDILLECLNLDIQPVSSVSSYQSENTYSICAACIWQLQEVARFRHQVQKSEEEFQARHQEMMVNHPLKEVKIELTKIDGMQVHVKQENSDFDSEVIDGGNDIVDDSEEWLTEQDTMQAEPKRPIRSRVKRPIAKKKIKPQQKAKEKDNELPETEEKPAPKKGREAFRLNPDDYRISGDEYVCVKCDKRFTSRSYVRVHIKRHYNVPRHVCAYCAKEFSSTTAFTLHKLAIHDVDDRRKCGSCTAVFNTYEGLATHRKMYHKMGEKHSCQSCPFETFSRRNMKQHQVAHGAAKEFHCKFCPKSFLRQKTLNVHEKIHTGDRRKMCAVCGQAFVQKGSLNYHMAKNHPEVDFK